MKPVLAYRQGRDPLRRAGAPAAIAFLMVFLVLPFLCFSPVVTGAVGVTVIAFGLLAGCRETLGAALRWGLSLTVLITVVNALVVNRGATILARLGHAPILGEVNVTLEAIVYGAALGLRVTVSLLVFAVYSACVNPDEVLRLLRPLARRSALTATLVTRLVPVAAADMARLAEATRLRGPAAASVGKGAMARRIVAGSLDRSVDVAATLELRGYSLPAVKGARPPLRRSLLDPVFYAAAGFLAAAGGAALLAGAGGFDTYPRIEVATDPLTLALAALTLACGLLPFAWARARAARIGGARA
jgi:energy-coupling factor transport system permease protein